MLNPIILAGVISTGVGSTPRTEQDQIAALMSELNVMVVIVVMLCLFLLLASFLAILFGVKYFHLYYKPKDEKPGQEAK